MYPATPAHDTQPELDIEDQFVWDNDKQEPIKEDDENLAMPAADKIGEKQKVVEHAKILSKQSKKTITLNTQDDKEAVVSVAELTKERGETALNIKLGYQTSVIFEWAMKQGIKTFNIYNAVINLLKKIGQVHPSMYVQSGATKAVQKNPDEIPSEADFTKAFAVK
eukprot:11736601-Ditylum_brightwellii.AAC.1